MTTTAPSRATMDIQECARPVSGGTSTCTCRGRYVGLTCHLSFVPWSSGWCDSAGGADSRHPHLRDLQASVQQPGCLCSSQAERLPADQHGWGHPQHGPVCVRGNGAFCAGSDDHQDHHFRDPDHHRYSSGGRKAGSQCWLGPRPSGKHGELMKSTDPGMPSAHPLGLLILPVKLHWEASCSAGLGAVHL